MGIAQSLKNDHDLRIKKFAKVKSITDFKFDRELRHCTPFPKLKSRLVSAEILKGYGIQYEVIKMVIILNRAGRAFILSQEGLPGLLVKSYTYDKMSDLLVKELRLDFSIVCTVNNHSAHELTALQRELAAKHTFEEKLNRLKQINP